MTSFCAQNKSHWDYMSCQMLQRNRIKTQGFRTEKTWLFLFYHNGLLDQINHLPIQVQYLNSGHYCPQCLLSRCPLLSMFFPFSFQPGEIPLVSYGPSPVLPSQEGLYHCFLPHLYPALPLFYHLVY